MGWYYYLEGKIRFPFQAKCIVAKVVSPLLKGETVEVRGIQPIANAIGLSALASSYGLGWLSRMSPWP